MGIKVSDVMLDLATGDASIHDAYIQEAVGQVKVSAAIYNAATKIASLDDADRSQIVQEAADAGLPSDREGSINLAYEAVERELIGTCRHLYAESAKIDETASKPTTPLAAVNALAKACGVKTTLNGTKEYAVELANAVIKNKDINLKDNIRFCKAASAKKMTKNLIQGLSLICNAFAISTDELFKDDTVSAVVPAPVSAKPKKNEDGTDNCTLAYMASTVKSAGKYVSDVTLSDSDYTTSITKNDLATVITCNFAAAKVAKFIKSKLGESGDKIEKKISKAVKSCKNSKSVSGSADELNECCDVDGNKSSIVKINEDLSTLCSNLIKAFNDSISALMESQN